jgi:hypothetical protein
MLPDPTMNGGRRSTCRKRPEKAEAVARYREGFEHYRTRPREQTLPLFDIADWTVE